MSSGWLNQKERSYTWMLKLMLWLAVNLGRRPCRFLLYPITLYYLFFSKITKKVYNFPLQNGAKIPDKPANFKLT